MSVSILAQNAVVASQHEWSRALRRAHQLLMGPYCLSFNRTQQQTHVSQALKKAMTRANVSSFDLLIHEQDRCLYAWAIEQMEYVEHAVRIFVRSALFEHELTECVLLPVLNVNKISLGFSMYLTEAPPLMPFEAVSRELHRMIHDIRQPLTLMMSHVDYAQHLVKALKPEQVTDGLHAAALREIEQSLEEAQQGCDRIQDITLFSYREEPLQIMLMQQLEHFLQTLTHELFVLYHIDCSIALKFHGAVWAWPNVVHRILFNLISNAKDALLEKPIEQRHIAFDIFELNHAWIGIQCTDSGQGISKYNVHRIFEEGFSTKHEHNHQGLGLSSCLEMMRRMGGQMICTSDQGVFTRQLLVFRRVFQE